MNAPGWRRRGAEVAVEAVRNVRAWRSRGLLAAILGVIAGAAAGALLASGVRAFEVDQEREDLSGAQVVLLGDEADPSGPLISRASCEGLRRSPLVRAAGTTALVRYEFLPRLGQVAVVAASPQLVNFQGGEAVIGADLATRAGLRGPGTLADTQGIPFAVSVAARQPEGINLNLSLAVPRLPAATVRSCVVWLGSSVSAERALPDLVAPLQLQGEGVLTVRAQPESGAASTRLLGRSDRAAVLIFGLFAGAAAGLIRRLRPADAVSYRLAGMSRLGLFAIVAVEDAICASLFVAAGMGVIAVTTGGVLGVASGLWLGAAGLAFLAASLPAALAVVLPHPLSLVKD